MQAKLKAQFVIGVTDTPEAMDKIIRDETANLTAGVQGSGHLATRCRNDVSGRAWQRCHARFFCVSSAAARRGRSPA